MPNTGGVSMPSDLLHLGDGFSMAQGSPPFFGLHDSVVVRGVYSFRVALDVLRREGKCIPSLNFHSLRFGLTQFPRSPFHGRNRRKPEILHDGGTKGFSII
jgi:hypothetical protein